jgi:hypothetical protein
VTDRDDNPHCLLFHDHSRMGAAAEGLDVNGVSQKAQSAVDPGPRHPDHPNRYSMITLQR